MQDSDVETLYPTTYLAWSIAPQQSLGQSPSCYSSEHPYSSNTFFGDFRV